MNRINVTEQQGLEQPWHTCGDVPSTVLNGGNNASNLTALYAVSHIITATQNLGVRQMLALAADKVMAVMDVDAVLVFLLDEATGEFTREVSRGAQGNLAHRAGCCGMFKDRQELNRKVARTGQVLGTGNAAGTCQDGTRPPESRLVVPLRSEGRVVGTLHAVRTSGTFYPDETVLLNCIGNAIGVAVGNTELHRETKQALMRLRQSEERYRALFEGAYDAIWVHDMRGNMLATNRACEKLTGYTTDELMTKNICHIMPEESKVCLSEVERRLRNSEVVDRRCEGEVVKKSGDRAIVQITTSLIMNGNKPIGFQHCGRDVTEERRLQDNVQYYLQQVTKAQEEERKRIARELHDEILQRLIAISRQLEKITSSDALWEESLETVRDFKKQVEIAVQEVRRFSRDLRPSILDDLGLLPALELLTDDLERRGISTSFKVLGESKRLIPDAEVMLFRIAQEATSNIRRHARASIAELVIESRESRVRLSITDNGRGFEVPSNAGALASLGKLGLAGMQERAKLLGGSLTLESRPGRGTIVIAEIPTKALVTHSEPPLPDGGCLVAGR